MIIKIIFYETIATLSYIIISPYIMNTLLSTFLLTLSIASAHVPLIDTVYIAYNRMNIWNVEFTYWLSSLIMYLSNIIFKKNWNVIINCEIFLISVTCYFVQPSVKIFFFLEGAYVRHEIPSRLLFIVQGGPKLVPQL